MIEATKGQLKAVERAIPRDDMRKILRGANVVNGRLEATDGKVLVRVHLSDVHGGTDAEERGVIPAEMLASGIKQAKPRDMVKVRANGRCHLEVNGADIAGDPVVGSYPNTDMFVRDLDDEKPLFCFDPYLMQRAINAFCDAAKDHAGKLPTVALYAQSDASPVIMRGNIGPAMIPDPDDPDYKTPPLVEAVIMPVKL